MIANATALVTSDARAAQTDQWDVQDVVTRVVAELQRRGYNVWFDLERMKGSGVTFTHCGRVHRTSTFTPG